MKLTDVWHFHRPALAKRYLDTLNAGVVTSTAIFARRRVGKTSFLLRDLTPAAVANGYVVAYADLWQTRTSPGQAIVYGLQKALEGRRRRGRVRQLVAAVTPPVKKIRASAQLGGGQVTGEVELERNERKDSSEIALQIDALIEELTRGAPLLLLVDEAQELARSRDNELVATALRAAMMTRLDRLRVLFTGSSRSQLAHVFARADAPLFSTGAAIADFPKLDRDFVEYIAGRFAVATRRELDEEAAWRTFLDFEQQPEPFLIAVASMALDPALSLADATAAVQARSLDADNYVQTWQRFNALQRALVKMMAADPGVKPFSQDALRQLRAAVGVEHLGASHVQRAMQGLGAVVMRAGTDRFEFEDQSFAAWVRQLDET